MLAQIALKNFLLEIVRRREEKHQHDNFYTNDNINNVLRLRIKEFSKKEYNKILIINLEKLL